MAATPAWPPASSPRLYVEQPLAQGITLALEGGSANYLANVLRLKEGAEIILFDGVTGSWLACLTQVSRRNIAAEVRALLEPQEHAPDLWLCAAPIKKPRFDFMIEKACELGIRRFQPVRTQRTIIDKIKPDKIRAHMIEAAEQCERNCLPELGEFMPLSTMLREWPQDRTLFFCDERLHTSGGLDGAAVFAAHRGPAALLIGPEGGFTDAENDAIHKVSGAVALSLGPRILRAETAALAAISVWMSQNGDWKSA